jgi:hypothetical protein
MFIPGSEFFLPRIPGQQYPGSGSASKNLSIFNPKNSFKALGNMVRDFHLDFFTHPGSRDQKGTRSRIRNKISKNSQIPVNIGQNLCKNFSWILNYIRKLINSISAQLWCLEQ